MKKLYCLFLTVMIGIGQLYAQDHSWISNRNVLWGSDYNEAEEFVIKQTEDLAQLAWLVNKEGKLFEGKTISLIPLDNVTYLDLSDVLWEPIGTNDYRFSGVFDGKNHTLKGIQIDRTGEDYIGLFGSISATGEIRNLNVQVKKNGIRGGNRVGGLAGACYGKIKGCTIDGGEIIGAGYSVGGLVGSAYPGSSIINSNSGCPVRAEKITKLHMGGLVGYQDGCSISNCFASGTVTAKNTDTSDMGGLVGYQKAGEILNCYATGSVIIENGITSTIGGLVGKQCDLISNSYATGRINAKNSGSSFVGGLIGWQVIEPIVFVINSFFVQESGGLNDGLQGIGSINSGEGSDKGIMRKSAADL